MAIRTELELGRKNFQQNWKRTIAEVKQGSREMKKETQGVGDSLLSGLKGMGGIIGITGVGAAAAAFANGLSQAAEEAQQLSRLSTALNEPLDALQRLDYVTKVLGGDFETVSELSRELEDRLGDLGNSEPVEVLERLGLEAESLIAMPIDQKLLAIADAFEKGRANGVGYSDLLKLVGDSVGEELLPILAKGREGLEELFSVAPALADESIAKLTQMNEKLSGLKEAFSVKKTEYFGSIVGVGDFIKKMSEAADEGHTWGDIFDRAFEKVGEEQLEFQQRQARESDMASDKAKAIAEQRAAEIEAEAESRREKEKTFIDKLESDIAKMEFDLLPNDEKLRELKDKLAAVMKEATEGTIFNPTMTGLQSQLDSARDRSEKVGGGSDAITSALESLKEAKEIEGQIGALEMKMETDQEKAEQELMAAREKDEETRFKLLSPEEQQRELRRQLSESLDLDISGMADLERGIKSLENEVSEAREAGDKQGEKAALERLTEAREQVADFSDISDRISEGRAPVDQGIGSIGQLFNQVMGREKDTVMLDTQRSIDSKIGTSNDKLDAILTKMDEQPDRDIFDDFPG